MANSCLTIIEATGIQPFIYGSNRLQENIGASEQVYRATTIWAFQALEGRHNIKLIDVAKASWDFVRDDSTEQNNNYDAEIVYAGGGKTLIVFRDGIESAKKFICKLTTRVLKEAPGLTLAAQHLEFDWAEEGFNIAEKHQLLLHKLAKHKQEKCPSMPLLGLGVTATCESTGLPAVCTNSAKLTIEDEEVKLQLEDETELPRRISRETAYKLGWRDFADKRLRSYFKPKTDWHPKLMFPYDVDKLGRIEGEESYVAVVHADANRMGEHFNSIADTQDWSDTKYANREWIKEMRRFSRDVHKASLSAIKALVAKLVDREQKIVAWDSDSKSYLIAGKVPYTDNEYVPFRPLVFGGDDVTFLCNARLGVSLAVEYLQQFEEQVRIKKLETKLGKVCARAGIAMVKMHYPFARAYVLSDALCKSAKSFLRELGVNDAFVLDWHFAKSGLSGTLTEIRRHEYEVDLGSQEKSKLYMRPLLLSSTSENEHGRFWKDGLETVLSAFLTKKEWTEHKNKLIGLREVLRKGPEETQKYFDDFDIPDLPAIQSLSTDTKRNGWYAKQRCVYFDAIELLDHYVPLKPQE